MNIGIVAKRDTPRAVELADDIVETLPSSASVVVDEATAAALERDGRVGVERMVDCDLVVSIGGDGTFLLAVHGAGDAPVMGVNLGEVGFLNAVAPGDAIEAVRDAVERLEATGSPRVRELPRLRATGPEWSLPPAVNEVAVLAPRRGPGGRVGCEVRIDGSLYAGGLADGVLVATPIGSTAYNLAGGGPLVHHDAEGVVVTELAATSSMPPLVVDSDAEVVVRVDDAATVVSDGRHRQELSQPAAVTVRTADEPARVAGPPLDFFAALGKLD